MKICFSVLGMKTFNEQVYDIVARIPFGRVVTYGQIAQMIGRPRMARFVGFAEHNKKMHHLPWHRVVMQNGVLPPNWADLQYKLLIDEGVSFNSDRTVNMKKSQWNPNSDMCGMDVRDLPLVF